MDMYLVKLFIVLNFVYRVHTQHVSFQKPKTTKTLCRDVNDTSLLEHFFNLVFSEYQQNPPICICVQMCAEQPMYCYPNGCIKRAETDPKKLRPAQVAQVIQQQEQQRQMNVASQVSQVAPVPQKHQSNAVQSLHQPPSAPAQSKFVMDSEIDYMDSYLSKLANNAAPDTVTISSIHSFGNINSNNPFDRYQSIFKRKNPQVHLRYNLRDQIKHKKSDRIKIDKLDVSRTSKRPIVFSQRKIYSPDNSKKAEIMTNSKAYLPHHVSDRSTQHQAKFFKRDLSSSSHTGKNINDLELKEDTAFSLETLIENLIGNTFSQPSTDAKREYDQDFSSNSNITTDVTNADINKTQSIISEPLHEATEVLSPNDLIKNMDENKHHISGKSWNKYFDEMVNSLSKFIERNNNSSIDMIEKTLGTRIVDASPPMAYTPAPSTTEPTTTGSAILVTSTSEYNVTDQALQKVEMTKETTSDILTKENKNVSNLHTSRIDVISKNETDAAVNNATEIFSKSTRKRDYIPLPIVKKKSHQKLQYKLQRKKIIEKTYPA